MNTPIPMILHCPGCGARHVDRGRFSTLPHHTHAYQACGFVWRPALVPTVGVAFLPGFKDEAPAGVDEPRFELLLGQPDEICSDKPPRDNRGILLELAVGLSWGAILALIWVLIKGGC